jgi:hypothetical protein
VPIVRGAVCPSCHQLVKPVAGELRTCLCQNLLVGIRQSDGESFWVSKVDGVEVVDVIVPYREQLELPL